MLKDIHFDIISLQSRMNTIKKKKNRHSKNILHDAHQINLMWKRRTNANKNIRKSFWLQIQMFTMLIYMVYLSHGSYSMCIHLSGGKKFCAFSNTKFQFCEVFVVRVLIKIYGMENVCCILYSYSMSSEKANETRTRTRFEIFALQITKKNYDTNPL